MKQDLCANVQVKEKGGARPYQYTVLKVEIYDLRDKRLLEDNVQNVSFILEVQPVLTLTRLDEASYSKGVVRIDTSKLSL